VVANGLFVRGLTGGAGGPDRLGPPWPEAGGSAVVLLLVRRCRRSEAVQLLTAIEFLVMSIEIIPILNRSSISLQRYCLGCRASPVRSRHQLVYSISPHDEDRLWKRSIECRFRPSSCALLCRHRISYIFTFRSRTGLSSSTQVPYKVGKDKVTGTVMARPERSRDNFTGKLIIGGRIDA